MRLPSIAAASLLVALDHQVPSVSAQTSLLGGTYQTTSNVDGIAKLSDDVAAIKAAGSIDAAKNILGVGNSQTATATGKDGSPLSIMSNIGASMQTEMDGEPYYHVFTYAMGKLNAIPNDEAKIYSNAILNALTDDVGDVGMVAESAVANTLWMQHAHYLEQALESCTQGAQDADVAYFLDAAIATYAGASQQLGVAGTGHSLYDLAEQTSAMFGTKSTSDDQAMVNEHVVTLYQDLQLNFAADSICSTNPIAASKRLRVQIHKIIQQSTVTLMQKMLYHLVLRNQNLSAGSDSANLTEKDYTEIYALQIYPLMSMCSIHDADRLRDLLIEPADKTAPVDYSQVLNLVQAHYDCLGFTCSDVGSYMDAVNSAVCATEFDGSSSGYSYAGYTPSTDIVQKSKLDLDVLLVGILLTEDKPQVARDVINKGFHSKIADIEWALTYQSSGDATHHLYKSHTYKSLSELAQADDNRSADTLPGYNEFVAFFDNNLDYGYSLLTEGIAKSAPFTQATPSEEILGSIMETLHLIVSHHSALESLYTAVNVCNTQGNTASSRNTMEQQWNDGAALLMGSIERGSSSSTSVSIEKKIDGQFMMSILKRNCADFGVCDTFPMDFADALTRGLGFSKQGECISLLASADEVQGMLQAVIIQSIMVFAASNESASTRSARGHMAVRALAPLMDGAAATQLQSQMDYSDGGASATDSTSVFNLLREQAQSAPALSNVKCEYIGVHNNGNMDFCSGSDATATTTTIATTVTATPEDNSNANADKIPSDALIDYVPTTNVEYILGFSDDLLEMHNADSVADAQAIFLNGKNAWHLSDAQSTYALAELSSSAFEKMKYEPVYNMYLYALKHVGALTDAGEDNASEFGKTTVLKVFEELDDYYGDTEDEHVAAGAAKLLIVFMEVVHAFYKAAEYCEAGSSESMKLAEAVDGAAAFYVGRNQLKGDASTGVSLYNLAEKTAAKFGTESASGEALVNEFVMQTFSRIQKDIVTTDACQTSPTGTSDQLLSYANEIVDQIKVMLVQGLIYNLDTDRLAAAELFGIALVPFVSLCDYNKATDLTEEMITNSNQDDPPVFSSVVSTLESLYSCMGFSCQDVGTLTNEDGDVTSDKCAFAFQPSERPQFQYVKRVDRFVNDRYVTLTDQTDFGLILEDIRDVVGAQTTADARDVFDNGSNAKNGMTLATLNDESSGDMYQMTSGWLDQNVDVLADTENFGFGIVTSVFDELEADMGDSKDDKMAGEAVILTIVATRVWHYLEEAVSECQDPLKGDAGLSNLGELVDRAAMLYIGQDQNFGSDETGYSFYRLAEFLGGEFGTTTDDEESVVNDNVLTAFDEIKQEFLLSDVCLTKPALGAKSLRVKVNVIINEMKTTMMQGLLKYADDDNDDYTELYALMVTPFVASCDGNLAQDMFDAFISHSDDDGTRRRALRSLQGSSTLASIIEANAANAGSNASDNTALETGSSTLADVIEQTVIEDETQNQVTSGSSSLADVIGQTVAQGEAQDQVTSGSSSLADVIEQTVVQAEAQDQAAIDTNQADSDNAYNDVGLDTAALEIRDEIVDNADNAVGLDSAAVAIRDEITQAETEALTTLQKEFTQKVSSSSAPSLSSIVSRLQSTYICMDITCEGVGIYASSSGNYALCAPEEMASSNTLANKDTTQATSAAAQGIDPACYLAGYCPTYKAEYLDYLLGYSHDIRDMANANDSLQAKAIFNQGSNAMEGQEVKTLASLSEKASQKMTNEFYYNVWQYALRDVSALNNPDQGDSLNVFGKTIVNDVLVELNDYYGSRLDDNMAAEAVKMNIIFMEVVHGLYIAANKCAEGNADKLVEEALDGSVSFYVGLDQRIGDHTSGYSLYNLAEKMSRLFNTHETDRESEVNIVVMTTFRQMQKTFVTNPQYCENNPSKASGELLEMAHDIINQMKVVMMQGLVHYMYADDKEYAELYGMVAAPLLSVCDYKAATTLKQKLVHQKYVSADFYDIMELLQDNYSCMGITCGDVGVYGSNLVDACDFSFDEDAQPYRSVLRVDRLLDGAWSSAADMGYFTMTDQTEFGGLLNDIKAIVQATDTSVGKQTFLNGSGVGGKSISAFSSSQAANDMAEEVYYTTFETFLARVPALKNAETGKANTYGVDIVSDIFNELESEYGDSKDDALAGEAVILTIVSMEIWHLLANSVRACESVGEDNTTVDDVAAMVDKAAMLYIGMDQTYGSDETGYSFYRLAEFTADEFGTKALDGQSLVNRDVLQALDNIKELYLLTGYCGSDEQMDAGNSLMEQAEFIINQMKATMIQGLIMYAAQGKLDYAEVYALQVAPLVSMCDETTAENILNTFVLNKKDLDTTNTSVYNAKITQVIRDMAKQYNCLEVGCEDVGAYTSDGEGPSFAQCTDSSTGLLGYETTTSVDYILGWTEDVRDMVQVSTTEEAKSIFLNGKNSLHQATIRPLTYLSTDAVNKMSSEPYYNLYQLALADVEALTSDGNFVGEFGKTIVTDVFEELGEYYGDSADDNMAAAAVVLHMFIPDMIHALYAAANQCAEGNTNMVAKALDSAFALFVGVDQSEGDTTSGFSIYHVAEKLSRDFEDTLNLGGTSAHNVFMVEKFKALQQKYVLDDYSPCDSNAATASAELLQEVHLMINKLKAVLVQGLQRYMYVGDTSKMELFALGVIPFVAACDYDLSQELVEKLVTQSDELEATLYDDIVERLQNNYSCMGMRCEDVGDISMEGVNANAEPCQFEFDPSMQPFKTVLKVDQFLDNRYFTLTDQSEYALVLDDIRDMVMADSTASAKLIFTQGNNDANGITLSSLSMEAPQRMADEIYFTKFKQYLTGVPAIGPDNAATYGFSIVSDVLDELESEYGEAKDVRMAGEAVILSIVSMEIWHYLAQTVRGCQDDSVTSDTLATNLDRAAMLYIGQDQTYGSSESGYSFYRLAEYTAGYFGTETADGESTVNAFVLDTLNDIKQRFVLSDVCHDDPTTASNALMEEVELLINQMKATMIQGFLMYAASGDGDFAELYALQVAPLLSLCESTSDVNAEILDKYVINKVLGNNDNRVRTRGLRVLQGDIKTITVVKKIDEAVATSNVLSEIEDANAQSELVTQSAAGMDIATPNTPSTVSGAPEEATQALMEVLVELQANFECMGLTCADIGTYYDSDTGVTVTGCRDEKTSTLIGNLAGYAPTSDHYEAYLNLSVDLSAIRDAAASNDFNTAKTLYQEGENAVDSDGTQLSLSTMNKDFDWEMSDQPFFNFFKYSLSRIGPLSNEDNDVADYAHTIVEDVFAELEVKIGSQKDVEFAAAAIVATHFWMQEAHRLYDAIDACESKNSDDVANALDDAVALYVGAGVDEDCNEAGNALYSIVQEMAEAFGTVDANGDSIIHDRIMLLFNSMQYATVLEQGCEVANNKDAVSILHEQANEIISLVTIPLVQKLIFNMIAVDAHYVELYALQITPLLATCDEQASRELQDMLILSEDGYTADQYDDVMGFLMPSLLKCMHISCEDIGSYGSFGANQCDDGSSNSNVVGINVNSNIVEYLRLDLDIRQVGMLMSIGAYDAAEMIVMRGQNVERFHSNGDKALWSFATIAREQNQSEAIDMVSAVLNRQVPYDTLSAVHGTALVTRTLQLQVTHQVMLQKLQEAQSTCATDTKADSVLWDEALALFVGSIEGTESGGDTSSNCGEMMYALAKETCHTFDTCMSTDSSDEYNSELNRDILNAFQAGAAILKSGADCSSLADLATQIEGLCNTILIQGTLYYLMESSRKTHSNPLAGASHNGAVDINSPMNKYGTKDKGGIVNAGSAWFGGAGGAGSGADRSGIAMADVSVIGKTLMPYLQVDGTSAATIDEATKYDPTALKNFYSKGFQSRQRIKQAFDAFATAIPNMAGVDCAKVGQVNVNGRAIGVCPVDDGDETTADTADLPEVVNSPIDQEESHDISNGLYQTATNVKDRTYIALDVWDVAKASQANNVNMARNIYRQGLNSDLRDEDGMLTLTKRTVADFSLEASAFMFEDLPYNTFSYALRDEYGYFEGAPASEYANTYVEHIFTMMSTKPDVPATLASEAMVALHIWMAAVHELYQQVEMCKRKANFATGRSSGDLGGVLPIDIAAAYVIGDSQQTGSAESGHLIYHLAEQVGEVFGQDSTGEAEANTKIVKALNAIKSEVTLPNACANSDTHIRLRTMADRATAALTVPLMQQLIHSMKSKDLYRTRLYAVAVVPLTAGCNEATHAYLRNALIDNTYNPLNFADILTKLQSTYQCLGMTCEDIGSYKNGVVEACEDAAEGDAIALAGYVPISDVSQPSLIDLDVQQMGILMSMGAMDAAQDLYLYGRNSHKSLDGTPGELLSLQKISTNPQKDMAATWTVYEEYKQEHTFSHSVISKVFDDSAPYDTLTPSQKELLVTTGMTSMVMFIESLRHMADAVMDCDAGDAFRNAHGTSSWDEAAASIIGSIEGSAQGGDAKNGGLFLYDMAKENCLAMNTCAFGEGKSKINERMELLLYTGQSQTDSYDCRGLARTSKELEGEMKTILLQGFLRDVAWLGGIEAAKIGSKNTMSDEDVMVRAYAKALSVAPFVYKADPDAANVIELNMNLKEPGQPMLVDGPEAVFAAISRAVSKMSDVDCNDIGFVGGFDLCSDEMVQSTPAGAESAAFSRSSYAVFATLAMMAVTSMLMMMS